MKFISPKLKSTSQQRYIQKGSISNQPKDSPLWLNQFLSNNNQKEWT